MISEADIESLKARTNIVEIVREYVELSTDGIAECPFHGHHWRRDKSLMVSEERQIFYCRICGKAGDAIRWLMLCDGMTFRQAFEALAASTPTRIN